MRKYKPVHYYGGVEHEQPGPIDGCLLCKLEAAERRANDLRNEFQAVDDQRREAEAALREIRDMTFGTFTRCVEVARAALDRHTHQGAPTFICVICNEDLTEQVKRKAGSSNGMPPSVVAICQRGHYTEFKTDALRHTHQDKAVT